MWRIGWALCGGNWAMSLVLRPRLHGRYTWIRFIRPPGSCSGYSVRTITTGSAPAQAFRAALASRPEYHEAEFNLAVVLQEGGDMEGALDHYARAWRLRPESFGRIAQALVSPAVGRLWLQPGALERDLAARA